VTKAPIWSVINGRSERPGFLEKAWFRTSNIAKARIRAWMHSRDVSLIRLRPGLQNAKHVVVMLVYNEARRMPFLLRYYRAMGFEHFVILDNKSADGLQEQLAEEPDVSLFFTKSSFKNARFGMDWINYLLAKYCVGKWILHVDADEFLVFPHCDTRGISGLTSYMEKNQQVSLQCLMLDMYSDKKIEDNICAVDEDPASICPFFDETGYVTYYDPMNETFAIKGGVRGRIYFSDNLWKGPALNKTPLVRWQPHYAFLKCAHELWPASVNGSVPVPGVPHGVLLHFKFLSDLTEKLAAEKIRQQHTNEYDAYMHNGSLPGDDPNFMYPQSRKYDGWRSLHAAGLLDGADGLAPEASSSSNALQANAPRDLANPLAPLRP
jgi:glycosyltransferase involved in cell wall biosynthesis